MMRSSPDASGGQPLTEAVPAPLISHMQFVDHVVLLHVGISGYLHLWQTVASAWHAGDHKQISLGSKTVTCGAYKLRSHDSLKDDVVRV